MRRFFGTWGIAVVEGLSMIPTLAPGDQLLIHYGAKTKIGDIVLVAPAATDGQNAGKVSRIDVKRIVNISGTQVFVQGDNAAVSTDSRHYGAISTSQVIGKIVMRRQKLLWRRIS